MPVCLFLAAGCVKELVPEKDGYEPKVAVWAILDPAGNMVVLTAGNRGIQEEDRVNYSDAEFMIFEDSVWKETLSAQIIGTDSLSHTFHFKPQRDRLYQLQIRASGLQINASVKMIPPLVKPDTILLSKGENARLSITLMDESQYRDAYQFNVLICQHGVLTDTSSNAVLDPDFTLVKKYAKYDEPSLVYNLRLFNNALESDYTFPVIDDLFNGKKRSFLFAVENPVSDVLFIPRADDPGTADKLTCNRRYVLVKSRKICPEYYNFLVSENANGSIFGTPYFNPTNVYSNVEGGLGLIAAKSDRTDTVWVKK